MGDSNKVPVHPDKKGYVNQTFEGETDSYNNNVMMTSSHASPADVSSVQVGDDVTIIPVDDSEGIPLKRNEVENQVKLIHRKVIKQLLMSALRNFFCYAGVVCLFIMLVNAGTFHTWDSKHLVPVVFIFCLGLPAIGFQILRIYRDLNYIRPSVVATLLWKAMERNLFIRRIQALQLAAPDLSMEVALKSGTISFQNPNHWTRSSRKTGKAISYSAWADKSMPVHDIPWPSERPAWIIVSKDYRCIDRETVRSFDAEAARFKRDTGYEENSYLMAFEYKLGAKDEDPFPDAEAIFVYDSLRPHLYNEKLYRASLFLCLDFFYRILFMFLVRNLDDYYIVKYIER